MKKQSLSERCESLSVDLSKANKEIDRLTTALRDIKKHQEMVCKSSALFSRPWMIANKALGYSGE